MTGHPDGAAICVRLNVFMLRAPLIATPAIVVVVAVVVPLVGSEFVSVSIVAGLIAVIGAWCVPATYTQGEIGSLLTVGQDVWTQRLARLKTLQLVVAGGVLVGLVGLELLSAAMAAMFGIGVALAIGAFTGASSGAAASDSAVPGAGSTGPGSASHIARHAHHSHLHSALSPSSALFRPRLRALMRPECHVAHRGT